jgi:hypothetical protein
MKFTIPIRDIPRHIEERIDIECGFGILMSTKAWQERHDVLLAEYNAVYDYNTDMITFDSEADYTFFILRWS